MTLKTCLHVNGEDLRQSPLPSSSLFPTLKKSVYDFSSSACPHSNFLKFTWIATKFMYICHWGQQLFENVVACIVLLQRHAKNWNTLRSIAVIDWYAFLLVLIHFRLNKTDIHVIMAYYSIFLCRCHAQHLWFFSKNSWNTIQATATVLMSLKIRLMIISNRAKLSYVYMKLTIESSITEYSVVIVYSYFT